MVNKDALDKMTPAEKTTALELAQGLVVALMSGQSWAFGEALAQFNDFLKSKGVQ